MSSRVVSRCGGYVVLVDTSGRRHAVRAGAIVGLSDADDAADMTVVTLPGGRVVVVDLSLDEMLAEIA